MCVEAAMELGEERCGSVSTLVIWLLVGLVQRKLLHARVFVELLKRCLWEEFEAWWQPGKLCGLSHPQHKGNKCAHAASRAVIAFIGDLFNRRLVPEDFVHRVLKLLIMPMSTIEQLSAVYLLLSRCNSRLYRNAIEFMRELTDKAAMVKRSYSGNSEGVSWDERHEYWLRIRELLDGWYEELMTET
ncbi:hypothetical protein C8Q80DRAFT_375827 [Daedaleopsis nitida]|nr:hypothetical protein C8Q80DRAFT_375827 [Daedaleopsis nitida]